MLNKRNFTFFVLLISFSLFAQEQQEIFSKIEIDLTTASLTEIGALGLEADHGDHAHGKHLVNFYSQFELGLLDAAGINYEIILPDAQAFYREYGTMDEAVLSLTNRDGNCEPDNQDKYQYETPENYSYGTMGGYLTYMEILENLDKMKEQYPNLITERIAIDPFKTHQGRSLYYLVISNSPEAVDTEKPQILYNALHHAREPNSISQLLFYMWYLLENYETDAEVTFLVDNTTMFFLPIINPDGYVYNERTNPSGGGFWRKNRYPNANGDTVGVDLNRNYAYNWNYDNFGSSNDQSSQTYRGPSAFSEPETQAVRKLCIENNFRITLNYHTYGNYLIHPWGYDNLTTDEDRLFKSLGRVMTADNDFQIGTTSETLNYLINGGSDDWMYGEQLEKNKSYSMLPEVGPSFWPSSSDIDQLNKSTVRHNLNAAHLLHNYGWIKEPFPLTSLAESGSIFYEFEKSGLKEDIIDINIVSETAGFTLANNSYPDLNMVYGDVKLMTVDYEINSLPSGAEVKFAALIDYGDFIQRIPFSKTYSGLEGTGDYIDLDSINTMDNFIVEGEWGLTDRDFFSAPTSIADSPFGDYTDDVSSEIVIAKNFNSINATDVYIKFQTKFDIEQGFDFVQFQVSVDDGPYIDLCGELTSDSESQFSDIRPVYQGQQNWAQERVCLNDYLGEEKLQFKFVFGSDPSVTGDGFYFDDFTYEVFGENFTKTTNVEIPTISIRPNPSADRITLQVTRIEFKNNFTYLIHDISGKVVSQGKIETPHKSVDISSLQSGSHVISILEGINTLSRTKFIKS